MNAGLVERVLFLRKGGHVRRFHTIPHHGDATVAEHTFQMLNLLFALHLNPSLDLVRAIMYHDAPYEAVTGDIPSPIKRLPSVKNVIDQMERHIAEDWEVPAPKHSLLAADLLWLHALDAIEGMLWCNDQLAIGNSFAKIPGETYLKYLDSMELPAALSKFVADFKMDFVERHI